MTGTPPPNSVLVKADFSQEHCRLIHHLHNHASAKIGFRQLGDLVHDDALAESVRGNCILVLDFLELAKILDSLCGDDLNRIPAEVRLCVLTT